MDVQHHESVKKQINSPTIYHCTFIGKTKIQYIEHTIVCKDVEELELSYSHVKSMKWYHHFEKQFCVYF